MPENSNIPATLSDSRINKSADIDDFFQTRKSQQYILWFNSTVANKGPWLGVTLVNTPTNDVGFHQFWDQIPTLFGGDASVLQFISLMSIFSNEVRGDFTPQTERMGRKGHPGMAYLFDAIEKVKISYNKAPNKNALECFNDPAFIAAHGGAPLADKLKQTTDARWSGQTWPSEFDTNPDPTVSGFITQADFMKFRGRGFIQTTWRSNYVLLVKFVQNHPGGNPTIDSFKGQWAGKTPDQVAFESTNDDWDKLFGDTNLMVAAEAVRVHSQSSNNYLAISSDPAVLNGTARGSVYYMGLRISGSKAYAATFKQRVAAVVAAI